MVRPNRLKSNYLNALSYFHQPVHPLSNKSIPRLLRPINPSSLYFLCIIGWKAHDTIISRGRGSVPGNRIECYSSCLIVASPSCPRWWPQKNYFVDFRDPENLLTPCLNEITTPSSSAACSSMERQHDCKVPATRTNHSTCSLWTFTGHIYFLRFTITNSAVIATRLQL